MRIQRNRVGLIAFAVVVLVAGLSGCGGGGTSPTGAVTAGAASTESGVAVQLCDRESDSAPGADATQPPADVSDFRGVAFDRTRMALYGVALYGGAQTVLGQADAACSFDVGGDGSTYISATGSEASLYETYQLGGFGIVADFICSAFPNAESSVNMQMAGVSAQGPCTTGFTAPANELRTGLPIPGVYVGMTTIPAGSSPGLVHELPASSRYTAWQIDYADTKITMATSTTNLDYKSMACAAVPAQARLCVASFQYFISGLITQSGYGKPNLSSLFAEIGDRVG